MAEAAAEGLLILLALRDRFWPVRICTATARHARCGDRHEQQRSSSCEPSVGWIPRSARRFEGGREAVGHETPVDWNGDYRCVTTSAKGPHMLLNKGDVGDEAESRGFAASGLLGSFTQ